MREVEDRRNRCKMEGSEGWREVNVICSPG